jgi:hypothetical protein
MPEVLATRNPDKLAELKGLAEEYKKSILPDFQAATGAK